jgi:hypothetical protein
MLKTKLCKSPQGGTFGLDLQISFFSSTQFEQEIKMAKLMTMSELIEKNHCGTFRTFEEGCKGRSSSLWQLLVIRSSERNGTFVSSGLRKIRGYQEARHQRAQGYQSLH